MMRIHFTVTDLARTRLARAPSQLTAAMLSTFQLALRPGRPQYDIWRNAIKARLRPAAHARLGGLAPTASSDPIPGFLRPAEGLDTIEDELERLLSTSRTALRADLEYVAQRRHLPDWTSAFADGDRDALAKLADSLRAYHRAAVAPYWQGLSTMLAADRAMRARKLRDGGLEQLLDTLHPRIRWRPPVLEVATATPIDLEYRLDGRGLLLAPAAFASYVPCDPADQQPTLYYEVPGDSLAPHPLVEPLRGPFGGLAALLGHSRAAVLEAIAEGASTTRLALRVGLSLATASEHASILRQAGLVATHRSGKTSHHTLTPLGAELLQQATTSASSSTSLPTGNLGRSARLRSQGR